MFPFTKAGIRVALLLIITSSVLIGCRAKKNLNYQKPENQTAIFLNDKLKSSGAEFQTLSFRVSVKAELKGKRKSFKASLRIRKDSAIWTMITFVGRPVATLLITKDSVKFMNRIAKEYFIGDFAYINQLVGSEITYEILEQMLIGNAMGYDSTTRYATDIDSAFYLVSSLSKRKIKKAINQG
ncbi:MAG: DUF4292 domain-containing protein, partial [Flavobacteriales bacterium]|nr:DUF4292 domain-containing protein [Flavobacteriales bacterium]